MFEQLSLQKATFDDILSNVWATFWEITENFLENLEQLVESPKHGCTLFYSSKRQRELHNGLGFCQILFFSLLYYTETLSSSIP